MGLLYLPTWMVDSYGKWRQIYQSHGSFLENESSDASIDFHSPTMVGSEESFRSSFAKKTEKHSLGGGSIVFLCSPLAKWSNLTSIFFKWVETTNYLSLLMNYMASLKVHHFAPCLFTKLQFERCNHYLLPLLKVGAMPSCWALRPKTAARCLCLGGDTIVSRRIPWLFRVRGWHPTQICGDF